MDAWDEVHGRVGALMWVPFAFQALRAGCAPLLLAIPRDHPRREVLAVLVLLLGLCADLHDGTIARHLRMTGLQALAWGDLAADLVFWIGGGVALGLRRSLAADLGPERLAAWRTTEARRTSARVELALYLLGAVVFIEIAALTMNRTLRAGL